MTSKGKKLLEAPADVQNLMKDDTPLGRLYATGIEKLEIIHQKLMMLANTKNRMVGEPVDFQKALPLMIKSLFVQTVMQPMDATQFLRGMKELQAKAAEYGVAQSEEYTMKRLEQARKEFAKGPKASRGKLVG